MLAEQFQHILVDEYQDTNAIQGAIVDLLASKHRNLTVVGDDSQSIYSFRGANFENIISFKQRYPDAREYRLETNYRSMPEILTLANASIAHNKRRLPKELRAHPALRPQARDRAGPGPLRPVAVHRRVHPAPARPGPQAQRHRRAVSQPLALAGDPVGAPAPQHPLPHAGRPAFLRAGPHQGRAVLPPPAAEPARRTGLAAGAQDAARGRQCAQRPDLAADQQAGRSVRRHRRSADGRAPAAQRPGLSSRSSWP